MGATAKLTLALLCVIVWHVAVVHSAACYSGYPWSGWGPCSVSCGGGFRQRHCYADRTNDREPCNVNCYWGGVYYSNKCHCPAGTREPCCEDIIECLSSPCQNGGKCNEHVNSFSCTCPPGTTGERCDDIADCASSPCMNGGTCHEYVNYYTCDCVYGTTGHDCVDILECASNPCQNGGTCLEHIGSYTCQCPPGTTGVNCDDIPECISNPCQNGGTCNEMINMYNCTCYPDYTGDNCELYLFSPNDEICRHSESCYIVFKISLTWEDAKEFCEAREGHLAVPNDLSEQLYLENYLSSMSDRFSETTFWIGGTKTHSDLPHWIEGNTVTEFRWPIGDPENVPGKQCLVMDEDYNYQWQARPCDRKTFFICEEKTPFKVIVG